VSNGPVFKPIEQLTPDELRARSRYMLGQARWYWKGGFFKDAEAHRRRSEELAAMADRKEAAEAAAVSR